MGDYIATKLHKAIEIAPDCDELQDMAKLPLYCIDQRLMDLLSRSDIQSAIGEMVEHELAKLPYPEIVIEFDCAFRHIVALKEANSGFKATAVTFAGHLATVGTADVSLTRSGIDVSKHASEADGLAVGLATAIGLLMSNVRGIEKEVIVPEALNKARVKSGKPSIPRFSIVRIGTVYDREGKAITGEQARRMPVHMRAGHARNQFYGEGRSERRLIYIAPTLVNFSAGDTLPTIKRKVSI